MHNCTLEKKCPEEYNKLIQNKSKCIDDCKKDYTYKYEYNNKCYLSCPKGTKKNNYLCGIIETKETKEIDEAEEAKTYLFNNLNINETYITTECSISDYFNHFCKINNNNDNNQKNYFIKLIRRELMSGNLNNLLETLVYGDLEISEEGINYIITTPENQKKNYNNKKITINLEECENILKKQYNISNNQQLIILKTDIFEKDALIPRIEYEVYSKELKQLNMSFCNNVKINICIPMIIDENEEFKYNISSEYYNDKCFSYTTKKGTDILSEDRKFEYIHNNMSTCEENCSYNGYNTSIKKVICKCNIKFELTLLSDIKKNKDELAEVFFDIKDIMNLYVMKCYYILFTNEGIKHNLGFYIMLIIILLSIISLLFFIMKGYFLFLNKIKGIKNNKKILL